MSERPTVAVTGACGGIGRALAEHLATRGYPLTLLDRPGRALGELTALGRTIEIDLAREPPAGLFAGIDVVVHLAADAREDAPWSSLLPNNIQAPYNVACAAISAGCRRLIVASSVHAVYASAVRPIAPDGPVAPADLYGVTKCFAEALAFWCTHDSPMSAAAVRIGAFQTVAASREPGAGWMAKTFISVPDLVALFERALTAEYRFAILHAVAPGADVLLDTAATEKLLSWRAEYPFPRPDGATS